MIRRSLSIVLSTVAVTAASLAWSGWLYLHTAADPAQGSRMVQAVLADSSARHSIATDLSGTVAKAAEDAIAKASGGAVPVKVDGNDPRVIAAVEAALADPTLQADVTAALTSVHAGAVGATPTAPPVLHADVLNRVVRQYVATAYPAFANRVPALPATTITLPTPEIPMARTLRSMATTWVPALALLAIACFLGAFALGRRPQVLRRAGFWAVGAGISWALLPRVATWAAGAYAPSALPIVRPAVAGLGGSVPAAATALLVAGVAAVVASIAWSLTARRSRAPQSNVEAQTTSHVVPASKLAEEPERRFGVRPAEPATAPDRLVTPGR